MFIGLFAKIIRSVDHILDTHAPCTIRNVLILILHCSQQRRLLPLPRLRFLQSPLLDPHQQSGRHHPDRTMVDVLGRRRMLDCSGERRLVDLIRVSDVHRVENGTQMSEDEK